MRTPQMGFAQRKIDNSEPHDVTINTLQDDRHELSHSIVVHVTSGKSGYTVAHEDTGVFAYDADYHSALNKFQREFVREYESLLEDKDHLSPRMQRILESFEAAIIRK